MLRLIIFRLFDFYQILIVVWCLLSWFPRTSGGLLDDISNAIGTIVCPYLDIFRRLIPPFGGVDFSPILAVVVLQLIERLLLFVL